jgi:hypothetical protein
MCLVKNFKTILQGSVEDFPFFMLKVYTHAFIVKPDFVELTSAFNCKFNNNFRCFTNEKKKKQKT